LDTTRPRKPRGPWVGLLLAVALVCAGCATSAPAAGGALAPPVTSIATPASTATGRAQAPEATRDLQRQLDLQRQGAWTTTGADATRRLVRHPSPLAAGLPLTSRLPLTSSLPLCEERPRDLGAWVRGTSSGHRVSQFLTAGLAAGAAVILTGSDTSLVESGGDILEFGMPSAALLTAGLQRDKEGLKQLGFSFGSTMALTLALKGIVSKRRPGFGTSDSFPSGHSASAFAGAAFLQQRYGPKLGIPAYALATYTALSRVVADKHFLDDVIAGSGLGLLSAWLFVTPCCDDGLPETITPRGPPTWRLVFAYGAILDPTDEVQAPEGVGTRFELTKLDGTTASSASSRVFVEYRPARRHVVTLDVDPMDITSSGTLAAPVSFDGTMFPAATAVRSRHSYHRYRLGWRYELGGWGPLTFAPGAVALLTDTSEELSGGGLSKRVDETRVRPLASMVVEARLSRALRCRFDLEGVAWSGEHFFDGTAQIIWQVDRRWDVGIGYHLLDARTDGARIVNSISASEVFIAFGRAL